MNENVDYSLSSNRLKAILEHLGISQREFARRLGISSANVSSMISGRRSIGVNMARNICTTFIDINLDWLKTGEGSMLNEKTSEYLRECKRSQEKLWLILKEQDLSLPAFTRRLGITDELALDGVMSGRRPFSAMEAYSIYKQFPQYSMELSEKEQEPVKQRTPAEEIAELRTRVAVLEATLKEKQTQIQMLDAQIKRLLELGIGKR